MILNKEFQLYILCQIYSEDKRMTKKFWTSFVGDVTVVVIPILWYVCRKIQQMDKITDAFVILVCTVGGWYKSEMGKGGKKLTLTKIRDSFL